jgi:hypothetical protein
MMSDSTMELESHAVRTFGDFMMLNMEIGSLYGLKVCNLVVVCASKAGVEMDQW